MAYESNMISFVGNLTEDPELRFTPSGTAVSSFRVASNRRYTDSEGNDREETTFLTVNAWRDLAENVAESVTKGDRVAVLGRIGTRSYEDQEGERKYVTEIQADEVAASLRWARAKLQRTSGQRATVPPPPQDEDQF